jgi:tetratricopeptide (TPR) repeat protein
MNRMRRAGFLGVAVVVGLAFAVAPALANPVSDALRAKASAQLFNLDRDLALATFRQATAADPQDAAAFRGMATALWLSITFRRGNMTVDDYLGRDTKPNASGTFGPPAADTAAAFRQAIDRAMSIARRRIATNSRDADAHYQLGAAVGLQASYTATVDQSLLGAFRSARVAYDEHERVLALDPKRKDAGLIVGTYRYIVSALSLPLRWMAYVVGFGGGRERGIQMIEEAATYAGDNEDDARFALILLYNREKRYDDALKQIGLLQTRFPKNRLMWLEAGSTNLRAGRAADAERVLSDGLTRFADDRRERMFGEDALWYYKRGAARNALGRAADAESDLKRALGVEGRKWVHGRSHLELGKLAQKRGDRATAQSEFKAAVSLCESDNDPEAAGEARRLMK